MSEDLPSQSPQPFKAAPSGLLIRAVGNEDCTALNVLSNLPGFRAGTLRLPYQRVEDTRAWLMGLKAGDLALVALLDGVVVGSAGLERFGGRRAHAAHLGMGVHDDFCGRGIGTALLRELVEAADAWLGLLRLELTVFADNVRAIRLYKTFGFEREGLQRCFAFRAGRHIDALGMARLRSQGTSSTSNPQG